MLIISEDSSAVMLIVCLRQVLEFCLECNPPLGLEELPNVVVAGFETLLEDTVALLLGLVVGDFETLLLVVPAWGFVALALTVEAFVAELVLEDFEAFPIELLGDAAFVAVPAAALDVLEEFMAYCFALLSFKAATFACHSS